MCAVCDFTHSRSRTRAEFGRVGGYGCSSMTTKRLDSEMAERGLTSSRSEAAAAIRAGQVRIGRGGERAQKPSQQVRGDCEIELVGGRRYVSRGGEKLEAALDQLALVVEGLVCLDVGASTGGFTDCLLQRGAERVVAVDVGHGQLDWGLRNDRRVRSLERTNARELDPAEIAPVDLVTIDVSFISLGKILDPVARCLGEGGKMLAMVKPQFELGAERVGRGGVVRELADRRDAVTGVVAEASSLGLGLLGAAPAGLPGPKGNREVFVLLGRGPAVDEPGSLIEVALR